jgi:predicted Zn finger-like uncharacterized protein
MLITTCPECETTFRISVGILEKAGGQVRCGRCANIFDANVKLREIDAAEISQRQAARAQVEIEPEIPTEAYPEAGAETDAGADAEVEVEVEVEVERKAESANAPDVAPEPEPEVGPAPPLDAEADEPELDVAELAWLPALEEPRQRPHWPWAAGAILLGLSLVGQLFYQLRDELITWPAIGPAFAGIYSILGIEVMAPVDLDQFNLLDLTALAEPAGDEQGWLIIETRVQNKGPKVQPYPHIFVRLLDRWEDTVAGRYFGPDEYTVSTVDDFSRMNIGTTIDAQFIIMDPGPSATGFELELCAKIVQGFMCESDENFN